MPKCQQMIAKHLLHSTCEHNRKLPASRRTPNFHILKPKILLCISGRPRMNARLCGLINISTQFTSLPHRFLHCDCLLKNYTSLPLYTRGGASHQPSFWWPILVWNPEDHLQIVSAAVGPSSCDYHHHIVEKINHNFIRFGTTLTANIPLTLSVDLLNGNVWYVGILRWSFLLYKFVGIKRKRAQCSLKIGQRSIYIYTSCIISTCAYSFTYIINAHAQRIHNDQMNSYRCKWWSAGLNKYLQCFSNEVERKKNGREE